jgi:hypothetical protein
MRDLRRARISISVAPSHPLTTRGGSGAKGIPAHGSNVPITTSTVANQPETRSRPVQSARGGDGNSTA